MKDGFELSIYDNDAFLNKIGGNDKVFIGSTVYPRVMWSLSTLSAKVNFFVNKCDVTIDGQS